MSLLFLARADVEIHPAETAGPIGTEEEAATVSRYRRKVFPRRGVDQRPQIDRRGPRPVYGRSRRAPQIAAPDPSRPVRGERDLEAVVSNTGGQVELRRVQFGNRGGRLKHSSNQRTHIDVDT